MARQKLSATRAVKYRICGEVRKSDVVNCAWAPAFNSGIDAAVLRPRLEIAPCEA